MQGEEAIFPLRAIAEEAVRRFEDPALENLKDENEFAIPWVAEHVPASCPRPRHSKITWNRMLEIGPTLGCNGCCGDSGYHNKECRARFNAEYGQQPDEPEKPADVPDGLAIGGYSEGGSSGSAPPAPPSGEPPFAPPEAEGDGEAENDSGRAAPEAPAAASWLPAAPEENETGEGISEPSSTPRWVDKCLLLRLLSFSVNDSSSTPGGTATRLLPLPLS